MATTDKHISKTTAEVYQMCSFVVCYLYMTRERQRNRTALVQVRVLVREVWTGPRPGGGGSEGEEGGRGLHLGSHFGYKIFSISHTFKMHYYVHTSNTLSKHITFSHYIEPLWGNVG